MGLVINLPARGATVGSTTQRGLRPLVEISGGGLRSPETPLTLSPGHSGDRKAWRRNPGEPIVDNDSNAIPAALSSIFAKERPKENVRFYP